MYTRCATALLVPLLGATALVAQTPTPVPVLAPTPGTILYPQAMTPWATKKAFGFSLLAMPAAIVQEAAALRWPLFSLDVVMGLPRNFLLAGTVSTQVVTNHLEVGVHWVAGVTDRLHADVGLGGAYWFGQLKSFGFDNTIHGTFLYPSASVGYDFGTMALTAQAKATYVSSLTATSGSVESMSERNVFDGMSYRVALEQPFGKHSTIGLAVQVNHLQFYYPQWPLFPAFGHRFWVPEAQIRVTL